MITNVIYLFTCSKKFIFNKYVGQRTSDGFSTTDDDNNNNTINNAVNNNIHRHFSILE